MTHSEANKRYSLIELERLCQKPRHRQVGSWLARRVARPLALVVTWVITPWPVSAHAVTVVALAVGVAAAILFAVGTPAAWLAGSGLLWAWYLLDHVDGQVARLRKTSSLDGVQFDYLMHHVINLVVPWGAGYGVARAAASDVWLLAGLTWGLGLLVMSLVNDTRYKAFMQRLKRFEGRLWVQGGAGKQNVPAPSPPTRAIALLAWTARKSCEIHVVIVVLTVVALGSWLLAVPSMPVAQAWLFFAAAVSLGLAVTSVARSLGRNEAEQEFARWYAPVTGSEQVVDPSQQSSDRVESLGKPRGSAESG